ncbi:MAG: ABC transporter permease, partial [Bacteroidota bacterium]
MKTQQQHPPQFAVKLLRWWAKGSDIEDLIGDMDEEFAYRAENESLLKARLFYIYQTFSLIFSYAVKRRKASAAYSDYYSANTGAMIMSYVKISVRNFSKHKLFTLVNVVGLALGMSVCLLALSIAVAIYQTDEWHERKADIYQINTYLDDQDGTRTFASTFPTIADKLTADYPFVEEAVAVRSEFSPAFLVNGSSISFDGYYASRAFFEIFDFPLLQGDPGTVLQDPNSIVLSQSMAYTLFRDEDPIGKMLETADGVFQVTGVMADPRSTHLYFDFLASASTYTQQADLTSTQQWEPFMDNYVYIRVRPNTPQASMKEALAQVAALAEEYHPDTSIELQATNLGDVVPQWNVSNNIGIGWDLPSLYFFFSIGLLILVPAIFNYTNLSIARALKRSKEIGIRKVVGAGTGQVKTQFIVETMVLTFIALLGSVLIYLPVKEQFLDMIYAAEVMDTSMGWIQLSVFLIFCLLVGWFAGLFPARFFASLNPVYTLKGQLSGQKVSVSGIKKGLFIFQFFVSLVFIIGVGAIAKQYAYVLNNNHGFNSDNVLVVPFERMDKQLAINELRNHPDVKAVTT